MNSRDIQIYPTVLEQNIEIAQQQLHEISQYTNSVQIDILDGIFEDNLTIGVNDLKQITIPDGMKIDMHLMVEYPEEQLGDCHSSGAYRAFGQIEKMHSQIEFVDICEELGLKSGLALDLYTPVTSLENELLNRLDGILLMSVKAGWSGQSFKPEVIHKITQLKELNFQGHILMDGGMNAQTICQCYQAGADQFGANNYFWKASDKKAALEISC